MNSQVLGGLASDQKIPNVFHAFGYSIPVGKDGRRLWPTKFKRIMGQRLISGELSIDEVQKTCQVSDKTAYKWKRNGSRKPARSKLKPKNRIPAFAEVKVEATEPAAAETSPQIVFKRAGCEVLLPINYPIDQLAELIRTLEASP